MEKYIWFGFIVVWFGWFAKIYIDIMIAAFKKRNENCSS